MIYASSKDAIKKKFTGEFLSVYLKNFCITDNYYEYNWYTEYFEVVYVVL